VKALLTLALLLTGFVRHDLTLPVMKGNTNQIVRVRTSGFATVTKLTGAEISYDGDIMTVRLKGYESDTSQAILAAKELMVEGAKMAK
jgi:hypothetical protein